jgi:hypothetical protein
MSHFSVEQCEFHVADPVEIWLPNGNLDEGEHCFPFKFKLPDSSPPSIKRSFF